MTVVIGRYYATRLIGLEIDPFRRTLEIGIGGRWRVRIMWPPRGGWA